MTLSTGQFKEIHQKLQGGGFTVNPFTGANVTEGIAVAPAANEKVFEPGTVSHGDIAQYHEANTERFDRGASLGGWRHSKTNKDFLDTPTVYPDTPGGVSRSRRQMLASNQIASYNIGTDVEASNPFHPENRHEVQAHDTPEQRQAWAEMPRRTGKVQKGNRITLNGQSFS